MSERSDAYGQTNIWFIVEEAQPLVAPSCRVRSNAAMRLHGHEQAAARRCATTYRAFDSRACRAAATAHSSAQTEEGAISA